MKSLKYGILFIMFSFLMSCTDKSKANGVIDEKLSKCLDTPNCVSTEDIRKDKYIEAISYKKDKNVKEIVNYLEKIIVKTNGEIIKKDKLYISAKYKTLLGFVDDVEIYVDIKNSNIQFRSISRVGYYDFGKNKSRYNLIKNEILKDKDFN